MKLRKYTEYITEVVYLFKTMFDSYEFIINNMSKNGEFVVGIEGQEYKVPVESYGLAKDKEFIFRQPSEISVMSEGRDIFEMIMNDIIYILNKNQLGYKFQLKEIEKEQGITFYHAIVSVDKETSISDLERIATTTKIVNPKVKDTGDFDKMIYQTK
jgi:hypothetical protein